MIAQNSEPADDESWILFNLLRLAKSMDDRYTCTTGEWDGDIYMPQEFRSSGKKLWVRFQE